MLKDEEIIGTQLSQVQGGRGDSREPPYRESAEGATPSNRAPGNPKARILRHGFDALVVTVKGFLWNTVRDRLVDIKQLAQSENPRFAACAQLTIGDHFFEVFDKGAKLFPYRIADNAFRFKLNKGGYKIPMAVVEISSEYLTLAGVEQAMEELKKVLDELGNIEEIKVKRIDLFADFVTDQDFS